MSLPCLSLRMIIHKNHFQMYILFILFASSLPPKFCNGLELSPTVKVLSKGHSSVTFLHRTWEVLCVGDQVAWYRSATKDG